MRSLGRLVFLCGFASLLDASWPDILESIGALPGQGRIVVASPGSAAGPEWRARVESGTILILEGASALAASLGFEPGSGVREVSSLLDVHQPKLPLILETPISVRQFTLPRGSIEFTKDRWSETPLVAGLRIGKGAVLWLAADPGPAGYERFPFIPHALQDLGWEPVIRSQGLWAFFDYSYRTRVDLAFFAKRWREAGFSALHVAAWHFFEADPERDKYLNALVEACHREGIAVYAWLELPHVSQKFWDDHPEWREKTATLQDAALDWRKLMNLSNPACARAVKQGLGQLLRRFDWDGVNLAELYYESLEGADNPSRFTPLNDNVRMGFRAQYGFDPADLWTSRRDPAALRKFLDYRAQLALGLQSEWLGEMEKARSLRPDLDIVLTHVDDRMDRRMTDAIGADSTKAIRSLKDHRFAFLIEDPATLWNLGPNRYSEIARRYQEACRFGIDINVVERYQNVYPTKRQLGTELFQLVHTAARAFSQVALYFENSIQTQDLPLLPAASTVITQFQRDPAGLRVDSPRGLMTKWEGGATVDGSPWSALGEGWITVPPGPHRIEVAPVSASPKLLSFNGELRAASGSGDTLQISYASQGRAFARLSCEPRQVKVDGSSLGVRQMKQTIMLPAGAHTAIAICEHRD